MNLKEIVTAGIVNGVMGKSEEIDIELFAGAGGMALGTYWAGFRNLHLYEVNPYCCETLSENSKSPRKVFEATVHPGDVSRVRWEDVTAPTRLLAAGAPCQPFSLGGKHLAERDGRNLFPEVFRAARALKPRAILIENVRGLLRSAFRPYFDYILRQLEYPSLKPLPSELWQDHDRRLVRKIEAKHYSPEYRVSWQLLNAADYGVAQIRHRVFMVATRVDLPLYEFPNPTHVRPVRGHSIRPRKGAERTPHPLPEWVTVGEEIRKLPRPSHSEERAWNNHWVIPGARTYPGHSGSALDRPSKTIKAGVHGVPGGENTCITATDSIRYYTLREAAKIQSFPDDYFFMGSRSQVIRQIGNAVPCKLAEAVARPLAKLLSK